RTRAASPPSGRSFGRIALRSSSAAAASHFLFQVSLASAGSPPAGAALPTRTPSPSSPQRQAAALRRPSLPCPAPKPLAPALRFPVRASSAETKARPVRATLHLTTPGPVARG